MTMTRDGRSIITQDDLHEDPEVFMATLKALAEYSRGSVAAMRDPRFAAQWEAIATKLEVAIELVNDFPP